MMICKKPTIKSAYPLPGYINGRNHWNNRAAALITVNGYKALQSYGTIVCVISPKGKFYRTWCGYSRTTANHINRFCDLFNMRGYSKKEWEQLPVYDTEIKPLKIDFLQDIGLYRCDYYRKFKIIY